MAALSKSEIIKEYPIGGGLDAFRDSFSLACVVLGYHGALDALQQFSNEGLKNLALDLLNALQNLSVARFFPSSNGRGTLRDDLFRLGSLVVSDDVDVNSVVPLIGKVIDRAPDEVVLNTVSALIAPRATPPTIFNKAALDTPLNRRVRSRGRSLILSKEGG